MEYSFSDVNANGYEPNGTTEGNKVKYWLEKNLKKTVLLTWMFIFH